MPRDGASLTLGALARPATRGGSLIQSVVILGGVWGASVVLQRVAVAELPPFSLAALRFLAALLVFVPFGRRIARAIRARPGLLGHFLVVGGLNPASSGVLTALALQHASSGTVALLFSVSPLLSALFAAVLPGQPRPSRGQYLAIGLAFSGVCVIVASGGGGLADVARADYLGYAYALVGALAIALCATYLRARFVVVDPVVTVSGQIGAALLVTAPFALLTPAQPSLGAVSPVAWMAVLLSGGIGLSAAFLLWVRVIARHGPTAGLVAMYLQPVAATLLGVVLLAEVLSPGMLVGGALVLTGVLLYGRG